MSGNAGLCQLAAVIIVSVEACGSAGLASCGNTDKADSPQMNIQEAACQVAGCRIGFLFVLHLTLLTFLYRLSAHLHPATLFFLSLLHMLLNVI